jgi:hypothetical protein
MDHDLSRGEHTAGTAWVRAALLGQLASLLLATVGACSESLSRQVRSPKRLQQSDQMQPVPAHAHVTAAATPEPLCHMIMQ